MTRPGSHEDRQREYFDTQNTEYMLPVDSNYVRRQVDQLLSFGALGSGARVLEIGCGMGRYTFPLAERGLKVEGLDVSPELVQRLRMFDGGRFNIPVHCTTVEQHPAGMAGAFDAVVGFFVLHHLDRLTDQFRAMAGLLVPGGTAIFLEPNPYNPLYYVQYTLSPSLHWWAEKGTFAMRRKVVLPAMREAGLVDPVMRRCGFLPPFAMNTARGPQIEAALERFPPWGAMLPFNIFRARLPAR